MVRKRIPWCIEVEFNPLSAGGDRPSEFYVVRRIVGDVKDLHLMVVDPATDTGSNKVSIDRRQIARVSMFNSTKGLKKDG